MRHRKAGNLLAANSKQWLWGGALAADPKWLLLDEPH